LMLIYSMWGSSVLVSRGFLYFSLIGSILAGLAMPFSGIWTLTLLCTITLIMPNRKETLN
jgi:hypothetical protein